MLCVDGSTFLLFCAGSGGTIRKHPTQKNSRRRLWKSPKRRSWSVASTPPTLLVAPLNSLNAMLSLLHSLDYYRNPSATGSVIVRPYVSLSRIHAPVRPLDRLKGGLNRLGGFRTARLVVFVISLHCLTLQWCSWWSTWISLSVGAIESSGGNKKVMEGRREADKVKIAWLDRTMWTSERSHVCPLLRPPHPKPLARLNRAMLVLYCPIVVLWCLKPLGKMHKIPWSIDAAIVTIASSIPRKNSESQDRRPSSGFGANGAFGLWCLLAPKCRKLGRDGIWRSWKIRKWWLSRIVETRGYQTVLLDNGVLLTSVPGKQRKWFWVKKICKNTDFIMKPTKAKGFAPQSPEIKGNGVSHPMQKHRLPKTVLSPQPQENFRKICLTKS